MPPTLRGPPPPGRTTTSFVRQLTRASTAPAYYGTLTQQTVSSYKVTWDSVRAYLEKKFPKEKYPNLTFKKEAKIINDKYVFMAPEALTSDDHVAIAQLYQKKPNPQLERDQSTEPAEDVTSP